MKHHTNSIADLFSAPDSTWASRLLSLSALANAAEQCGQGVSHRLYTRNVVVRLVECAEADGCDLRLMEQVRFRDFMGHFQ